MFKVNEIKSWAKKHDIVLKRKDDGYVWEDGQEPVSIDEAVKLIFNKVTDNKYLEHQRNYASGSHVAPLE